MQCPFELLNVFYVLFGEKVVTVPMNMFRYSTDLRKFTPAQSLVLSSAVPESRTSGFKYVL